MPNAATKRKASRSDVQQQAEVLIIGELSKIVGFELTSATIPVGKTRLEVDGFYHNGNQVILAEAWAHVGKIKPAQRNKVHSDILKLGLIRTNLLRGNPSLNVESYIAFIDEAVARIVTSGRCWASIAAQEFCVTAKVLKLPEEIIQIVREAQKRQDTREADDAEDAE